MKKIKKYIEKYKEYSITQLKSEKESLENSIKICQDYIETAHNTFLGPFGAIVTIKSSCIRLEAVKEVLREKENQKSSKTCSDCTDSSKTTCSCMEIL